MVRLLTFGTLSAFFFSSTFVLNRAMSLQGGHWVWTASLRYGYMLIMLFLWLILTRQKPVLSGALREYCKNWIFWTFSGSIGFGAFYALLTFSSTFAPGWVVATTWQTTILASPVVLLIFGKRVPARGLLFSVLIFIGILMVSGEQASSTPLSDVLLGTIPVIFAAFAYPLGNQMVWEARNGTSPLIPRITDPVVDHSIGRVLLMVIGSLPFWIVLILFTSPPPPTAGQLLKTGVVAVFSGIIATSLFLHARHGAKTSYELAAVDATQSTEVIFSLLGEILFLHGSFPSLMGSAGVALAVAGLILYIRSQTSEEQSVALSS